MNRLLATHYQEHHQLATSYNQLANKNISNSLNTNKTKPVAIFDSLSSFPFDNEPIYSTKNLNKSLYRNRQLATKNIFNTLATRNNLKETHDHQ